MQHKVITLTRNTVLWHAGDGARDVAVLEKGKLGVQGERGLVGVMLPHMVLGDSALLAPEGAPPERRSLTVLALEDETQVGCYPAAAIRDAINGGDDSLARTVLDTLVGQICRNLLLVLTARRGDAYVVRPLQGLIQGVIDDAQQDTAVRSFDDFVITARFLSDLRDLSDRTLAALGPDASALEEQVEGASSLLEEILKGRAAPSRLADFLTAEREKAQWWARGAD